MQEHRLHVSRRQVKSSQVKAKLLLASGAHSIGYRTKNLNHGQDTVWLSVVYV